MAQETENMQNEDLGQKLNAMLSDPETMHRLAGMASALASSGVLSGLVGTGGEPREDGDAGDAAAEGTTEPNLPTAVSSGGESSGRQASRIAFAANSRHSALLRALKPYLGQEKQARIDQMMRLLQLAELADTVLRGK